MAFKDKFKKYELPTLGYIRIPKLSIPPEDKARLKISTEISEVYLSGLIKENLELKIKNGLIPEQQRAIYEGRIKTESTEISRLYFVDYILLIYRIIKFCKDNGILNGFGRGSCGGSLILYLLDVTKVDPITYDLLFERFISASRTEVKEINGGVYIKSDSLPDVDIDSEGAKKHLINHYIESLFPKRTAAILNILGFQGKLAIKECLKVTLNFSEEDSKRVSSLIETKFGKVDSIAESLENNEEFKAWIKENPKHQTAADVACIINSLIKTTSVHASGIILCENELEDTMPCQLTNDKKIVVSYDMNYCQLLGIKVDNLGLKNLNAIHECFRLTGVSFDDFDPNDPAIYEFLNKSSHYYGIFQAEEGLGKDTLRKIKPQNIDDITLSISLGRPGSMKYIKDYIDFKEGRTTLPDDYPEKVKDVLGKTAGIPVYQESVMKLSRIMADFTPLETNSIRKAIGKKKKSELVKYKKQFIEGSLKNGYQKEFAERIWQSFEDSGDYSFNLSHASCYGHLLALSAWLKAKYTKEFFLSLLRSAKDESNPIDELTKINAELPHFGMKLLPPHLLKSDSDFTLEGNDIRFGLSSIKGISEKTIDKLKHFKNEYSNKLQVFQAAEEAGVNLGVLCALLQAGALDGHAPTRSRAVLEAQLWSLLTPREKKSCMNYGEEFKHDLLGIVKHFVDTKKTDESKKAIIKDSRFETIKKNYAAYKEIYQKNCKNEELTNWYYEKYLLGYSYSTSLKKIYSTKNPNFLSLQEIQKKPDNTKIYTVASVQDIATGKSRAKGTRYFKMSLNDESGTLNALMFNDKIDTCKNNNGKMPEDGDLICLEGVKKGDAIFVDMIGIQSIQVYTKLSQLKQEKKEQLQLTKE